jgi:hypothetical protein
MMLKEMNQIMKQQAELMLTGRPPRRDGKCRRAGKPRGGLQCM